MLVSAFEPLIEPFRAGMLRGVLDVLASSQEADAIDRSSFVRKALLDPNFDPAGAPVALAGDEPVGFALAIVRRVPLEDAPPDDGAGYVTLLGVRSDHRGLGIGSALLAWCERFLAERACTRCLISPYAPGYFSPGVDMRAYSTGLRFLVKRGYAIGSRPVSMECDLTSLQTPEWVQGRETDLANGGILIHPYDPEWVPALLAFLRAHFPGDWQRFARAAIERIETGDAPTRLWIARRDSEVIGYSHHEGERFGPIGVSSENRSLGIGHALMYRTLGAMRRSGFHVAWFLWSDDRTAARLYAGAGFRVKRRFAVLKKEIAG